jgi:hypothetical protein
MNERIRCRVEKSLLLLLLLFSLSACYVRASTRNANFQYERKFLFSLLTFLSAEFLLSLPPP